ncbi:uncharacterized protein BDZ99DRAFT_536623 [Mytilinidion resinicola]|uniref:Uncharacterized protein n=1 Tax=Mytilinidion resinicola TaxID=574789 RepID=A0A6A6YFH3_9PEZI|nr:uncharacterized protein BDZ99DRAFT_536623 [Mytilinidion resinicola]KAF2807283.1 hypothetical protein BDZ99DRAFT_536623 [Mytilinidion resinicola]
MLARASSDAGARLRRSKSTSSVTRLPPPLPEPLDPEVAQKHALAAATTAYARAHELELAERARSRASTRASTLSRTKSNASRHSEGRHFPARESSLRFCQSPKGGYISAFPRQSIAGPDAKLPRIASVTPAGTPFPHPTPVGTPLAQPTLSFDEIARPATQFATHRNSLAEPPNTIRKARSMYYASSVQTGSPVPRPPAKYLVTPPPASPTPERRRSFLSDLGISSSASAVPPRLPATISGDETVDKVRDRYLQDFQKRQLRQRPSFILGPFKNKKRQEKEKGRLSSSASRSVGSVVYDNIPPEVMTSVEDVTLITNPQKEKRSFSNTLKSKIKRVFRRTSLIPTTLPVQQIDASRDYFSTCVSPPPLGGNRSFDDICTPDHTTLNHTRTQDSSLDIPEGSARPGSRASSIMSNFSASRVTSWNSSTIGNSTNKRLSVIHEAKGSIASEAAMLPPSPTRRPPPVPALSSLRDPVQMDDVAEECSMPVDPRRVFSALMKESGDMDELREGEEDSEIEDESNSMCKGSNHSTSVTLTNQSRISDLSKATKGTIRTVTPDPLDGPAVPTRTTSVRGAVRIPRDRSPSRSPICEEPSPSSDDPVDESREGPKPRRNRLQRPPPHAIIPTADQIASRVEKSKGRWKTPLEDDKEHFPFFPKSTRRTYTVSTFARKNFSFRHSNKQPTPSPEQVAGQEENFTLHTPLNPRDLLSPLSPSVYSQASDGQSLRMNDSAVSLANSEADYRGTAVIINSTAVKSYALGTPQPRPLAVNASARSSKDWKNWLSNEVAELELSPQEDITIYDRYTNPGHRREHADILDVPDFSISGSGKGIQTVLSPAIRQRQPTMGEFSESGLSCPPGSGERSSAQTGQRRVTPGEDPSSRASWSFPPGTGQQRPVRPTLDERPSSRMNERFPFIETGRKTSSQSSCSRTNPSRRSPEADTPSSRVTPTPDSRIYTRYDPPPSDADARYEPKRRVNDEAKTETKENGKENALQSLSAKSLCIPPRGMSRPQSLQPLRPCVWNRSHSSLAHYTTSAEEKNYRHSMPPITPPLPRARPHLKSLSASSRPKSAFDLRGKNSPTKTFVFPPGAPPENVARSTAHTISHVRRKPITGRALEGETLKMILAGPYSSPSPTNASLPSPISKLWLNNDLNASPSQSSLRYEPTPSPERARVMEDDEREGSVRSVGSVLGCPGTPTAGQRLAEKFLRARTVGVEGLKNEGTKTGGMDAERNQKKAVNAEGICTEGIKTDQVETGAIGDEGTWIEGIDTEQIQTEGVRDMTPAFL